MDDQLIAALDECLAALAAGDNLNDMLARYPALEGELRPLVEAARAASAVGDPVVPRQAQMTSRARFLGRAAELRSAGSPTPRPRWSFATRAVTISLAFLVGFVAGAYGVAAASAQSLPGDALYGVKRAVERTQLFFSPGPQARAELEAEFSRRRIVEVRTVTARGHAVPVEFTGQLESQAGERWTVAGVVVVVPAGTEIAGVPLPGRIVTVYGTVQPDMTVLALRVVVFEDDEEDTPLLTPAGPTPAASSGPPAETGPEPTPAQVEEIEFTGVVEAIGADVWQVGGRVVVLNPETEIRGDPQVGQTVEVRAIRDAGGQLVARRIQVEDSPAVPGPTHTPEPGETPESTKTPGPGGGSGPSPSNTPDSGDGDDATPTNTPATGGGQSSQTPEPQELEIEGTLESISGSAWVVAGQTVLVTGETEIRDNPQVGDRVRVRAARQPDGTLIAERIERR